MAIAFLTYFSHERVGYVYKYWVLSLVSLQQFVCPGKVVRNNCRSLVEAPVQESSDCGVRPTGAVDMGDDNLSIFVGHGDDSFYVCIERDGMSHAKKRVKCEDNFSSADR